MAVLHAHKYFTMPKPVRALAAIVTWSLLTPATAFVHALHSAFRRFARTSYCTCDPPSSDAAGSIQCLFSDIDGTLVHYYDDEDEAPGRPEVVSLPPSSTGRMGRISLKTLQLAAQVRKAGTRLVLVSGTRYSTFETRLPYLPRADAYVIENGGRIFYPKEGVFTSDEADVNTGECEAKSETSKDVSAVDDPELTAHTPSELEEDLNWRRAMAGATGPLGQDDKDPSNRDGPLWDLYRKVVDEGFEVDTNTYYTMIRIKAKAGDKTEGSKEGAEAKGGEEAVKHLLGSLPVGLHAVTNFGLVDICPDKSGKQNAASYLAREHFGLPLERCASMGDDDNDIALANIMGKGAFITAFTSESVAEAARADPARFRVAKERGVYSSEEMLRLVLKS